MWLPWLGIEPRTHEWLSITRTTALPRHLSFDQIQRFSSINTEISQWMTLLYITQYHQIILIVVIVFAAEGLNLLTMHKLKCIITQYNNSVMHVYAKENCVYLFWYTFYNLVYLKTWQHKIYRRQVFPRTWVGLKAISHLIPPFGKLMLLEYMLFKHLYRIARYEKQLRAIYIRAIAAIIQLDYVKIQ